MQSQSHNEMFSLVQDILINYIQKSFKIKKLVSKKLKYIMQLQTLEKRNRKML